MFRNPLAVQLVTAVLATGGLFAEVDFNRDIRPILSNHCFACHGPDEHDRRGELRLDTEEGALRSGDIGDALVPGKPDDSEIIHRIFSDDPEEVMPPPDANKALSAEQRTLLRQWIEQGGGYAEPWSYRPPERHPVPEAQSPDWPANWIDNFILDRLRREGLEPAQDTDCLLYTSPSPRDPT